MFYSQYLLSKKGPLGIIWIAAHLERKLRKKQIAETDIGDSVDSILYSEVPIALRISSHLLLGVVKIYAKKVDFLFHDCSEALLHIAQAFQTSAINLSPKAVVAPYRAITLPESFDFDDLGAYVDPEDAARAGTWAEFEHHVSDRDLITLQEPFEVRGISQSLFTLDGGFSEGPNPYNIAGLPTEDQISRKIHAPPQDIPLDIPPAAPAEGMQAGVLEEDILPPLPMEEDIDLEDMDDGRERILDAEKIPELEKGPELEERPELDGAFEGVDKMKAVEVEDVEVIRVSTTVGGEEVHVEVEQTMMQKEGPAATDMDIDHHVEKEAVAEEERHDIEEIPVAQAEKSLVRGVSPPKAPTAAPEEDVLGAILGVREPKPAAEVPLELPKRRKRKRKPVSDNVTAITSLNMKRQLGSSSGLVRLRKKAPCTEYQIWMSQRENNIDLKFSGPSVPGNGAIASNGPLSYSSSYDTDSEHLGKFMEDKSGWASRTRAVAIYLKEKFEAQGIDEQRRLSLHNILKGRRRKEAACMFFEILMLRSKDFIQVEQHDGVSDINIQPTERLMKGSW